MIECRRDAESSPIYPRNRVAALSSTTPAAWLPSLISTPVAVDRAGAVWTSSASCGSWSACWRHGRGFQPIPCRRFDTSYSPSF